MALKEKIKNAGSLGELLVTQPSQVRNLRRWSKQLRQPPLDARLPWLPFDIIDFLQGEVNETSRVFEFGGGGSTLWFAERAGYVRTVENDSDWYEGLKHSTSSLRNIELIHRPLTDADQYVNAVVGDDELWDIVVVDGRERVRCVAAAAPFVRPGGLLILDDTDRSRYARAADILQEWQAQTFRGLAPYKAVPAHTTAWRRPTL